LIAGDVNGDKLVDFVLPGAAGSPDKLFIQRADGSFHLKPDAALNRDAAAESVCGVLVDVDRDGDNDLIIGSGGNEPRMPRNNFLVRVYRNDGQGNFSVAPTLLPPLIGNFSTIRAADFDKDGDQDLFLAPGMYREIMDCRRVLIYW
jgi:hypothetical protein